MNDENFISLYFVVIIEPLIVGKLIKCHIPNLLNLQTMPAAPPRPLEGSDDAMSVRFRMFLTPMTIQDYPGLSATPVSRDATSWVNILIGRCKSSNFCYFHGESFLLVLVESTY